ncbi:hypothetical protein L3V86_07570 [Thiotrichales bacterium 19S11-10]|nr:hypothetical protein [Thiotrichales bacterium 19S11-10]
MKEDILYIGDLHGHALKLPYSYKDHIDNLDFEQLKQAYHNNDVIRFIEIFENVEFKDTIPTICSLGDVLAERGQNDLMTLCIIDKMHKSGLSFNIIYSNHDAEFIHNIEGIIKGEFDNISSIMEGKFIRSLRNLIRFMESNSSFQEKLKDYIKSYLAHLCIASVDHTEEGYILATHAPLNEKIVRKYFDLNKSLKENIEKLNRKFIELLGDDHEELFNKYYDLIWNRETDEDFDPQRIMRSSHPILHVHGHHNDKKLYPSSINLNSFNGQDESGELEDKLLLKDSITLDACKKELMIEINRKLANFGVNKIVLNTLDNSVKIKLAKQISKIFFNPILSEIKLLKEETITLDKYTKIRNDVIGIPDSGYDGDDEKDQSDNAMPFYGSNIVLFESKDSDKHNVFNN